MEEKKRIIMKRIISHLRLDVLTPGLSWSWAFLAMGHHMFWPSCPALFPEYIEKSISIFNLIPIEKLTVYKKCRYMVFNTVSYY